MEISKPNFSLKQLLSRFRRGNDGPISPDSLWHAVLGGVVLLVCIIGAFAYFTYIWAVSIDATTIPVRTQRDVLSVAELKEVIAIYQNKEKRYNELLQAAPEAPEYLRGRSMSATPVPDVVVTPVPSLSPSATTTSVQ